MKNLVDMEKHNSDKLKRKENTNHCLSNHKQPLVKGQRASSKAQPLEESSRVTCWPN